ncbi:hypothetical protein GQR58_019629 [Nymphon striatum]|nr:hypothetical protein GQR58_019629 [Nymphon striatum]
MTDIFKEATALSLHLMQENDGQPDEQNKISEADKLKLNIEDVRKVSADDEINNFRILKENSSCEQSNGDIHSIDIPKDNQVTALPLKEINEKCYKFRNHSFKKPEIKLKQISQSKKENAPSLHETKHQIDSQNNIIRSETFKVGKPSIQRKFHVKNSIMNEPNRRMSTPSSIKLRTNISQPLVKSSKSDSSYSKMSDKTPDTTADKKRSSTQTILPPKVQVSNMVKTSKKNLDLNSSQNYKTNQKNNEKLQLKSQFKSSEGSNKQILCSKVTSSTKPTPRRLLDDSSINDSNSFSATKVTNSKPSSSKSSIPSFLSKSSNRSLFSSQRSNSSFSSSLSSSYSNDVFINQSDTKELPKIKYLARPASIASHQPHSSLKKPVNNKMDALKQRSVSLKSNMEANNRKGPMRAVTPLSRMVKPSSVSQKLMSPLPTKSIGQSDNDLVSTPGNLSFKMADPLAISTPNNNK